MIDIVLILFYGPGDFASGEFYENEHDVEKVVFKR